MKQLSNRRTSPNGYYETQVDFNQDDSEEKKKRLAKEAGFMKQNAIFLLIFVMATFASITCYKEISRLRRDLEVVTSSIIKLEEYYNDAVPTFNQEIHTLEENFIPIVIYVYNRPHYLEQVLSALSKMRGIEKTMLIISHDGLNRTMLDLVRSIKFCQVKQIFHPGSPIHPTNARALKEHWWWLLHALWNNIFPNRNNDICFIEEDHVVSPDFYEVLHHLVSMKQRGIVSNCSTVALGSYNRNATESTSAFVTYRGFINTGYAFNRTFWNQIIQHEELFQVVDPDWDSSLVEGLMDNHLIPDRQITPMMARVHNIGKDGMHITQDYSDQSHPHTDENTPLLREDMIDLYHLSNDNSIYQINRTGIPKRTLVCSGKKCFH